MIRHSKLTRYFLGFFLALSGVALVLTSCQRSTMPPVEMLNDEPVLSLTHTGMPGITFGTGTHFEITDSDYLNVTLDSNRLVEAYVESIPEMVSIHLEATYDAAPAQLTLGGLLPNTSYHQYLDDYHQHTVVTTDASGTLLLEVDLSEPRLVFFQTSASTKFLRDDGTGGDCTLIGSWDAASKTCILTQDVFETIQFDANGLTLDGNGYALTGSGSGYGVFVPGRSGVTIRKFTVQNFSQGVRLQGGGNHIVEHATLTNNVIGLHPFESGHNTLRNNTVRTNTYGIYLYGARCNYSTIASNLIADNDVVGVVLTGAHHNIVTKNTIQNTVTDGLNIWDFPHLTNAVNNLVTRNNFINNGVQAKVRSGLHNSFSLAAPENGNYWNNFDEPAEGCFDIDMNRICDAPYIITSEHQDSLPWNRQNGWDTVPPTVTISKVTAPQDGFLSAQDVVTFPGTVGTQPVSVEVSANDVFGIDTVTVNEVAALGGPDTWTALAVPLEEGPNTVTATAVDIPGNSNDEVIQVTLDLDLDNDGLRNNVDESPLASTSDFSDQALGGVTSGRIVGLDSGVTIEIADAATPQEGISAVVTGTAGNAKLRITGSKGTYRLSPGEYVLTAGSVTLEVIQGYAEVEYLINNTSVVVTVEGGATAELEEVFDGDELRTLDITVLQGTVTINGIMVEPGEPTYLPIPVDIDIKPGSYPNCFNNNEHGVIPVAILSGADFDATEVDASTVVLDGLAVKVVGKSDKLLAHTKDVNGDGLIDLVVQINDTDEVFNPGDTTATLTGELLPAYSSLPFIGYDTICIVP